MSLFTIPPDVNFLAALAAEVLRRQEQKSSSLSSFRILLPNRRACQNLKETFLDLSGGRILLLPQIRPLGDVEEDALFFADIPEIGTRLADIPPAISETRRRFLLVQLIRQMEAKTGLGARRLDQALHLAQALGQLLDQVVIEELSFDALERIVPADYAHHWQITLDFLAILRQGWPQILQENGVIDAADRRNRLLNLLSEYWQVSPPEYPVIAAGSTGTMPATARLLKVISTLPQGAVILPGLDQHLDAESWERLEAAHPQSLLKDLLYRLDIPREDVRLWPGTAHSDTARHTLAGDLMRPAATAYLWQEKAYMSDFQSRMSRELAQLALYECDSVRQEAMVIALKLRETLETSSKTAALVTPDRVLARQVRLICRRWGIHLDDTAGVPLSETVLGGFLSLPLHLCQEEFRPALLLGLLKHPLCAFGEARSNLMREALQIDLKLRGPAPKNIWDGLEAYKCIQHIQAVRTRFSLFENTDSRPLAEFIGAHIDLLEHLAATPLKSGAEVLWQGEEGEAAALFFAKLLKDAPVLGRITAADYLQLFQTLLKQVIVRPKYGTHPRLLIMGQIEARLMKADMMILGGLNEGTWPALPETDPWMSRPMRASFGLPDPERHIALAAHDFIQAFSAPEVVLTRTVRTDGVPSVPARWLQRLDIVLRTYGCDPEQIRRGPLIHWAQTIDRPQVPLLPAVRPAPSPVIARRPTSLPVTAIERWMRDPYSLYARYVLRLKPLDKVEQDSDFAQRGSWLHAVFEWFVRSWPEQIPPDAVDKMEAYALSHDKAPASITLFLPRLRRLLEWFVAQEREWRKLAMVMPEGLECSGKILRSGLELSAKADRIDRLRSSGAAVIIDYKTGSFPSAGDISAGLSPQLPLEALILEQGGFPSLPVDQVESLYFWKPGSGAQAGEVKELKGRTLPSIEELILQAQEGLDALISDFKDEKTPYICLPDPEAAPPAHWQDYAHLARVQEWIALEDGEGDA
ncbi:MAG: PD-(D/E)XK nuclease family protein [Rhodospirillales bacterium]|nr:PD-(D/E)XK nuclease family protein [Rhodospirillales bacterium]